MTFTQVIFLFAFFPISTLLYLIITRFGKRVSRSNFFLLVIGGVFYWWAGPKSVGLVATLILFTYYMGLCIEKADNLEKRRRLLILSLVLIGIVFFVYKYLPLFPKSDVETETTQTEPLFSEIIIPISLSFLVLAMISYLVDIYRKEEQAGDILSAFTYMTLYPKMLCGPIMTWKETSPQLISRSISVEKLSEGISRIIIGLAKKAILADTFRTQIALIDYKMGTVGADVPTMWLRALLYFFMIYCDFSGYSDIALGILKVLGFEVGENFNFPYLATSISDFWRRWHMSLYRWMKHYIYIPLGGSKSGNMYTNIFITFILAGAWHGGRLNVIVWAAANALLVIADRAACKTRAYKKTPRLLKWMLTIIIVYMGWVMFNAPDLAAAAAQFKGLFVASAVGVPNFEWRFYLTKRIAVFLLVAAGGAFGVYERLDNFIKDRLNMTAYYVITRILLLALFALDILFVVSTHYKPFIYSLIG